MHKVCSACVQRLVCLGSNCKWCLCTIETCSRVWFWFPLSFHGTYLVITTQAAEERAWITPLVVNVCKECILIVECRQWLIFTFQLHLIQSWHILKIWDCVKLCLIILFFYAYASLKLLFFRMWCWNCCPSFTNNRSCKQRSRNFALRLFFMLNHSK